LLPAVNTWPTHVRQLLYYLENKSIPHSPGRGSCHRATGQAMIAVFYGCGLRRMEGLHLNLSDIDLTKRLLFVSKGKGHKQRYVPIASNT
jgi:site-specific recombinase XerD